MGSFDKEKLTKNYNFTSLNILKARMEYETPLGKNRRSPKKSAFDDPNMALRINESSSQAPFRINESSSQAPFRINESSSQAPILLYPSLSFPVIFIILFMAIGFFCLVLYPSDTPGHRPSSYDYLFTFESSLNELLEAYPNQSSNDIAIIRITGKKYLRFKPDENPIVLTLAHRPANHSTPFVYQDDLLYEFASELASALAQIKGNISKGTFRSEPYSFNLSQLNGNHNDQKLALDTKIAIAYGIGFRVFLFSDVEKLSPKTALIFHTLCDDLNAPYPGSLYILLVNPNNTCDGYVCPTNTFRNMDTFGDHDFKLSYNHGEPYTPCALESYLAHKWSHGIGDDKVGALLSRIGSNIAFMNL